MKKLTCNKTAPWFEVRADGKEDQARRALICMGHVHPAMLSGIPTMSLSTKSASVGDQRAEPSLQIGEFREPRKNRNQNASGLDLWGMKQKHARSYGRYVWLQLELFQ
jgi:hypothetical protein